MTSNTKINIKEAEILIIDDTPANIDLLYKILSDDGYKIAAAPSGEIALKITPDLKPDLILLDVMMPGLNGFETCRLLKQDKTCQDIPVIFITAKTDIEDIVEGFEAGAVDYITKPIKEQEVLLRVKTHLQLRFYSRQQALLLEMIKEHEIRNRSIINQVNDPLITIIPPGIIESVNPAALDLFGYTTKELIGKPFNSLLKEDSAKNYLHCFNSDHSRRFIEANEQEVFAKNKDNLAIPISLSVKQLSLKYPLFLALIHDLSAHRKTIDELQKVSNLDQLTKIANRRRFDSFYELVWKQAKRQRQFVALIMIDIDYFKQYNDNYGHQAGDVCLREVAQVMEKTIVRASDLLARYGGEEFIVVLPNTELEAVEAIADNIRKNIEDLAIEHQYSKVAKVITVSLGVVSKRVEDKTALDLICYADEALYQAKQQGRNRLVAYNQH